jgi:hypothetical protein
MKYCKGARRISLAGINARLRAESFGTVFVGRERPRDVLMPDYIGDLFG